MLAGKETGNGEGHGDAVVAKAIDGGTLELGPADDLHAIVELGDGDAHAAEVIGYGGDAVCLLHAELSGIADAGRAVGQCSGHGEDGEFINHIGDFGSTDDGAVEITAFDDDIAADFATGVCLGAGDLGAHAEEDGNNAGAGGIEPDIGEGDLSVGDGGSRYHPEGGAGDVTWHGDIHGLRLLTAVDGDGVVLLEPLDAEVGHEALGVVAGLDGLHDAGLARGKEACQEDGAFHLSTGHGEAVSDGLQLAAADLQRSTDFITLAFHFRTHEAEGIRHTLHRSLRERGIACEGGGERLPSQDAG
jgi:hypothetical protein